MDKYELLKEDMQKAAHSFLEIPQDKIIRIVSHFDADGITAAAILSKLMIHLGRRFHLTNVQNLTRKTVEELSYEDHGTIIFADLGSGQLHHIDELLSSKRIFILDHHIASKDISLIGRNTTHLNPLPYGIDGNLEVSGAGMSYLFARSAEAKMIEAAHLALIGAIADQQEDNGFFGLNIEILSDAVKSGNIAITDGLRLFGTTTKPLHKALEFSTDFFIPGVTGSETGALDFLKEIGINPKNSSNEWKRASQLTEQDMQKLALGIMRRRKLEKNPDDIFGNLYLIKSEDKTSPFRNAKEFATILNAAGRLGSTSIGVAACLGDNAAKEKAARALQEYQYKILSAFRWLEDNKGTQNFIDRHGYAIINAGDDISPGVIGTLNSIVSRSGHVREASIVLTMSRTSMGTTKISLRFAGKNNPYDLREISKRLVQRFKDSEFGGHRNAAGGLFPTENEKEFVSFAEEMFEKMMMEESVG